MDLKPKTESYNYNLFEVDFICEGLTKSASDFLQDQIIEVSPHKLEFQLNIVNKTIMPLDILADLFSNNKVFDIKIKPHNKDGSVLGEILYKNVKITRIDFFENNFNYGNANIAGFELDLDNNRTQADIEVQQIFYNGKIMVK